MSGRQTFQQALDDLQSRVVTMAELVAEALGAATTALVDRDGATAAELIRGDERINNMWTALEQDAIELIATQQPMARDLREILAVAMIATDLERIGDHAKHIASSALNLLDAGELPLLPGLEILQTTVVAMLRDATAAFVAHDAEAARHVATRDEHADREYERLHRGLIARMVEHPKRIDELQRLVSAAKRLERSGDHVTNICEQVVFLATGALVELNP